jgi:hypothetical protein
MSRHRRRADLAEIALLIGLALFVAAFWLGVIYVAQHLI